MFMPIVWTRIRRVAGIAASMARLLSSSMADATMIHMSWMCCFLPFKGRLMLASPNNSSKSEQDDRKGRPIGINLSWEVRQEAGRSVGARVVERGRVSLYGRLWVGR